MLSTTASYVFSCSHVGTWFPNTYLETLTDEHCDLAAELERYGLISADVVRRLACDATIIIGVDDGAGHTMYEGRGKRLASATQRREAMRRDRHCRFPGCPHVLFTQPHHIKLWNDDGPTDLPNLATLCSHHHTLVHTKVWTMTGDANGELTFVGPGGRIMTSRPSPLWTRVTAPTGSGSRRRSPKGAP